MFFKSRKADCLGIEDWFLWKAFADKTKRERKIAQNCDFALINQETEKEVAKRKRRKSRSNKS